MTTLKDLIAQKETLEKLIQDTRQAEKTEAINKIKTLIFEHQLTQQDIFGVTRGSKKPKSEGPKVAAKYRDPDSGKEWSGRGLAPKWMQGKDKALFLIA
jgi:DNA-binding protein H-NS